MPAIYTHTTTTDKVSYTLASQTATAWESATAKAKELSDGYMITLTQERPTALTASADNA